MSEWETESLELRKKVDAHLKHIRRYNIVEYQRLIDAESAMYRDWLDQAKITKP